MIHPQDLRIGNWVLPTPTPKLDKVINSKRTRSKPITHLKLITKLTTYTITVASIGYALDVWIK